MEDNFILFGIIAVILINLTFYYFINKRKDEKDLKDYFKRNERKHRNEKG